MHNGPNAAIPAFPSLSQPIKKVPRSPLGSPSRKELLMADTNAYTRFGEPQIKETGGAAKCSDGAREKCAAEAFAGQPRRASEVLPQSSDQLIAPEQLKQLKPAQVDTELNRIYARHGYFPTREDLREGFMKEGYKLDPKNNPVLNDKYKDSDLQMNATERQNIAALAKLRTENAPAELKAKLDAINGVQKTDNTRVVGHTPLKPEDVAKMSADNLRYMRNEIAAGAGHYDWKDAKNMQAFSNKTWYTPGKDSRSSEEQKVDAANTKLLFSTEMQKRYPQLFQTKN
jgi:hypothetical protein